MAAGVGCCFALGLRGGWVLGCGVAVSLDFGWSAGAGFAGVRCRPALPVAGRGAAAALAVAGAPAEGTGSEACADGVARGLGDGVPGEGVVMEVEEAITNVATTTFMAERARAEA